MRALVLFAVSPLMHCSRRLACSAKASRAVSRNLMPAMLRCVSRGILALELLVSKISKAAAAVALALPPPQYFCA